MDPQQFLEALKPLLNAAAVEAELSKAIRVAELLRDLLVEIEKFQQAQPVAPEAPKEDQPNG